MRYLCELEDGSEGVLVISQVTGFIHFSCNGSGFTMNPSQHSLIIQIKPKPLVFSPSGCVVSKQVNLLTNIETDSTREFKPLSNPPSYLSRRICCFQHSTS